MFVTNIKKLSLIAFAAAVLTFGANAAYSANIDNRMRTFVYGENDIYTIVSTFGYQTVLELDPQEKILTISMGNPNLFKIVPAGNKIYIKAIVSNQITNMFVITDKRQYQFDLSSYAKSPAEIIYVAKFIYPEYIENPAADTSSSSGDPMSLYNRINPNAKTEARSNYNDYRLSVPGSSALADITHAVSNANVSGAVQNVPNPYSGQNDPRGNFFVKQGQANSQR